MESAPLVPQDDDSLLFINAGVTPLKKYFDGSVVPDNKRLVSIQKCIRTNDIDNVGVTKSHQTFFALSRHNCNFAAYKPNNNHVGRDTAARPSHPDIKQKGKKKK